MARTILLADDSMTIQKVVELTFMDEDFQVVAVSDGATAIQKLSEMRPDLVIADVHMPGASGYDVCRQAKASMPELPVLLLVGTFEQFDEAEAQACGADGSLKKPFDSQELLSRAQALVAAAPAPAAAAPVAPAPVLPSALPQEPRMPEMPTAPPVAPVAPPVAEVETTPLGGPTLPTADAVDPNTETRPMPRPVIETEPTAAEATTETVPAATAEAAPSSNGALSDADVDRIARRVAELIGEKALKEIAWEVLPDLAEVVVRERIHELERQVESA